MSITVTGRLRQAAEQRQVSNGTMFFFKLGKKEYDFTNKCDAWANYSIGVYANDKQIGFYQNALVEGAIVEVSGSGILPVIWGDNGDQVDLRVNNAKIGFIAQGAPKQQQGGYQQPPQQNYQQPQGGYQGPAYQQPQQPQGGYQQPPQPQQQPGAAFDESSFDDIPF